MKKRIGILFLIGILAVTAGVLAACGKKTQKTQLVDFPETATETVDLNTTYSLRPEVQDVDGNSYTLNASVKTKLGADVTISSGGFFVSVIDGYTVTYTAKISDSETQTSVITVNVVDKTPPTITIGSAPLGYTGELYTLPGVTFVVNPSSTVAESSVKVFYVVTEGDPVEQTVTTTGDTRTFTPAGAGIYRISAYVKDSGGRELTKESEFRVIGADNEVFNAAASGAAGALESRRSYAADLEFTQLLPGDNGHDDGGIYKDAYISIAMQDGSKIPNCTINPSSPHWATIFLKSSGISFPTEYYDDYNYISIWYYIATEKQVNVNTAYLNWYNRPEAANEWHNIILDRTQFFNRIGAQYLIAPNNVAINAASNGITEIRLGSITAHKEADFTVTDTTASGITSLAITGPTSTIQEVSVYENDTPEAIINSTSNHDNVWVFSGVSTGNYTVVITLKDDPVYIFGDRVNHESNANNYYFNVKADKECGEFAVEGLYTIKLPIVTASYKAGEAVTIPDAEVTITDDDAVVGTASKTIKYIETVGGTVVPVAADAASYTPDYAGKLQITYTYAGAAAITLTIPVGAKAASADRAVIEGKDAALSFTQTTPTWVDEDGGYVRHYVASGWGNLNFNAATVAHINSIKGNFAFLHVRVYAESDRAANWDAPFFNNAALAVSGAPTNAWFDAYIPVASINTGNWFMTANFNAAAVAYPYIRAIRLAGFEFVAAPSAGATLALANSAGGDTSFSADEDVSFALTADGTPAAAGYKLDIYSGHIKVTTLSYASGGFKWDAQGKEGGNYKAVLIAPTGYYVKQEKTFAVTNTTTIEGQVFNPANHDAPGKITAASNPTYLSVFHVQASFNNDPVYGGAYVGYAHVSSGWMNLNLTPTSAKASYAEYDYISVWVYFKTMSNAKSDIQVSFYNQLIGRESLKTDTWTEVRLDAAEFAARANPFLAFNFSGNMGVVEIRFGEIAGKNAVANQSVLFDAENDEHIATGRVSNNGGANVTASRVLAADNDNSTYGGAYMSFKRTTGATNFFLRPPYHINYYADFDYISVWVYLGTEDGIPGEITVNFFNGRASETFDSDTWIEVKLDAVDFVAAMLDSTTGNETRRLVSVEFGTYNELRVGTITAGMNA